MARLFGPFALVCRACGHLDLTFRHSVFGDEYELVAVEAAETDGRVLSSRRPGGRG
jgi:hypothetical protein